MRFRSLLLVGSCLGPLTVVNAIPSAAQASSAAVAAGAGVGNSLIAAALQYLVDDLVSLAEALLSGVELTLEELYQEIFLGRYPELIYSYGGSPSVFPSPNGTGNGLWAEAYTQARALVAEMTDDEKNLITYGSSDAQGCSGFVPSVGRVGFSGICLNDAESGVRGGSLVNGYPAQIHVGASWNRTLAYDRAYYLGREFKGKGINVLLGPVVGPIGRLAKGGRNWEGFSNDPYLAGELVGPTVEGMQKSVVACVKHLIANEQETNRMPFLAGVIPGFSTQAVSSNLDDRTMHELYLWPFYDAVKAGAGSVMASYNRINNSYATQNSKVLNGLLKYELGFQGFVVSDWTSQRTGIASANAGLDLVMPVSTYWDDNKLVTAVQNGSMKASRLDDMAVRILASWYRFAKFDTPGLDSFADTDVRESAANPTIFQSAVEGHVLLKNTDNILPLKKPAVLSLFGYDAPGGHNTSSSDSLAYPFGLTNTNRYPNGSLFTGVDIDLSMAEVKPYGWAGPPIALAATLNTGAGSGAITPTSSISPYDAFLTQAALDDTILYTDFTSQNPTVNSSSDACIVFLNTQSSESWDRENLADDYSDMLVQNVAAKCENTIVVIHNAGIRLVDNWIELANVKAVIFAHVPGQESGSALTEIMYGRQSPSGRLPYSIAKQESDYGPMLNPAGPTSADRVFPQSNFTEGLAIDYKYFIQQGIEPRFPFGYGLTYSNFSYTNLQITINSSADTSLLPPDALNPSQVAPEGGLASLYDEIAVVEATIKNTGNFVAAEVVQLYLGIPNSLPKVLRGFEKQLIKPGQSSSVSFPLRRRDLSMWDVSRQHWVLQTGTYTVMVGKSVLDIQLTGSLRL